jgi:hypothetical protein
MSDIGDPISPVNEGPDPDADPRPFGLRTVTEDTAQRLIESIEGSRPIRQLRSSQIATGVVGAAGLALFLVGVEKAAEDIPILENAYGSIIVGLILLAITGLLIRKLVN